MIDSGHATRKRYMPQTVDNLNSESYVSRMFRLDKGSDMAISDLIGNSARFIGSLILGGCLLAMFAMWYGGYHANAKFQEQGLSAMHDKVYKDYCPGYFQSSYIERMTSSLYSDGSWCNAYKDRL
jgi:hypothetical protein